MIKRTAKAYLQAYESAIDLFQSKNCLLDFFRLDNETSGPLETFMKANARSFQYVPPNNRRANMAEIAVRDGKTHLIAILCGVHPSFPNGEWDHLVPYAELTLNLLRPFGMIHPNRLTLEFMDRPMILLHILLHRPAACVLDSLHLMLFLSGHPMATYRTT